MSLTLRKNDKVIVITGASKGKVGKILRVDLAKKSAFVEGANVVKRYAKKTKRNPQGGLIEQEAPIRLSNLALYSGKLKKGVRFNTKILKDRSKVRFSSKTQEELGQV